MPSSWQERASVHERCIAFATIAPTCIAIAVPALAHNRKCLYERALRHPGKLGQGFGLLALGICASQIWNETYLLNGRAFVVTAAHREGE
jgi:hypothetical protein